MHYLSSQYISPSHPSFYLSAPLSLSLFIFLSKLVFKGESTSDVGGNGKPNQYRCRNTAEE